MASDPAGKKTENVEELCGEDGGGPKIVAAKANRPKTGNDHFEDMLGQPD